LPLVLDLREGDVEFADNYGGKRMGRSLARYAFVIGGKLMGLPP